MIEQLVGQFLGSQAGQSAVAELGAQGLSPQQANGAVTATAEGVAAQLGGGGGANPLGAFGALLGGGGGSPFGALLGGGDGNLLGALGGLLDGGSTNAAPGGSNALAGLAGPIGKFVAEKTGLAPALAQTVVSVVLPKVVEWFQSNAQPSQR